MTTPDITKDAARIVAEICGTCLFPKSKMCDCRNCHLTSEIAKALTAAVLEVVGDMEKKTICGSGDCDCCQRNAGWNERNTAIQSKLAEMGITPKT